MGDASQTKPDVNALITAQKWDRLSLQLTRYAFACVPVKHQSWHDAEDRAQEAIANFLDPKTRSWDPTVEPVLFKHLARLVRIDVSARRKRIVRHRETEYEPEEHDAVEKAEEEENLTAARAATPRGHPSFSALADVALIAREDEEVAMKRFLDHFAKDAKALLVLGALERYVSTIQAQADDTRLTFDEVRSARRRLSDFAKKLEQELAGKGTKK